MKFFVLFGLLVAGVAGQFEEVASVPVKVRASDMCEGEEVIITQRPEEKYEVKLGGSLKVTCGASGMPMPYVYWVKGKKDLTNNEQRMRVTAVGQSILYIPDIQPDDIDIYTCVVEDCCRGTVQTMQTELIVRVNVQCTRKQSPGYFWAVVWEYSTWQEAKEFCKSHDMELASPKNEFQNRQLHAVIQESMGSDPNGKKFAHHNMIWMGISDGIVENGFTNINTGEPISYSNWMDKQPDNWNRHDSEGQDVVAIDRVSGQWDDSYGFWKRPFACWCPPRNMRNNRG